VEHVDLTPSHINCDTEAGSILDRAETLARLRREGDRDAIVAHVTRLAAERGNAAYERASKRF
jgi:hypothetical protein